MAFDFTALELPDTDPEAAWPHGWNPPRPWGPPDDDATWRDDRASQALTQRDPGDGIASGATRYPRPMVPPGDGTLPLADPSANTPRQADAPGNVDSAPPARPWNWDGMDPASVPAPEEGRAPGSVQFSVGRGRARPCRDCECRAERRPKSAGLPRPAHGSAGNVARCPSSTRRLRCAARP